MATRKRASGSGGSRNINSGESRRPKRRRKAEPAVTAAAAVSSEYEVDEKEQVIKVAAEGKFEEAVPEKKAEQAGEAEQAVQTAQTAQDGQTVTGIEAGEAAPGLQKAEAVPEERQEKSAEAMTEEKPEEKSEEDDVPAETEISLFIQFQGREITMSGISERFEKTWVRDFGRSMNEVGKVAFYVKPEDSAVYFVVNDDPDESGSFGI